VDEFTTNLIRTELSRMNDKKKLNEQFLSLYEKFVIMLSMMPQVPVMYL